MSFRPLLAFLIVAHLAPAVALAQMHHEDAMADTMSMPMPGMSHPGKAAGTKRPPAKKAAAPQGRAAPRAPVAPPTHAAPHAHTASPTMPMAGMDMSHAAGTHAGHAMTGLYGPYPLTREASGTAWQPDAAEHAGIHGAHGPWMLMLHGMADLAWTRANGPRGDEKVFGANMAMGTASRLLGGGTFGLRAMLSLEPATIGRQGYPLLLQTGETADGVTPLVDRQHPHDLFMELAGSYAVTSGKNSVFVYGGLPGEPALGPPAFMHRFSGASDPLAPITHHWLDSSHITFGVLTAGAVFDRVKVEASAFRGREPDEDRWNLESPKLDSHSFRLSVNPSDAWALQVSHGRLESPEQLEPGVDQDRTTASAIVAGRWQDARGEATLAWGRNRNRPGHMLDAWLAEAAVTIDEVHTIFARAERVEKDELLLPPDARAGRDFEVGELSAGYRYDFARSPHATLGLGILGSVALVSSDLRDVYGDRPGSMALFAHAALR